MRSKIITTQKKIKYTKSTSRSGRAGKKDKQKYWKIDQMSENGLINACIKEPASMQPALTDSSEKRGKGELNQLKNLHTIQLLFVYTI